MVTWKWISLSGHLRAIFSISYLHRFTNGLSPAVLRLTVPGRALFFSSREIAALYQSTNVVSSSLSTANFLPTQNQVRTWNYLIWKISEMTQATWLIQCGWNLHCWPKLVPNSTRHIDWSRINVVRATVIGTLYICFKKNWTSPGWNSKLPSVISSIEVSFPVERTCEWLGLQNSSQYLIDSQ